MTQRDLARLLKRPHSYVAKSEWGDRRVDPLEFGRWARACRIPPSEVLDAMGLSN